MPPPADFARTVFISAPEGPLLQAMVFCVVYLGFVPQVAVSGELSVAEITQRAERSKFSIHDLSGREDVPLELAIDYGCRQFKGAGWAGKRVLIFQQRARRATPAGCEVQRHMGDYQRAVSKLARWLARVAGARSVGEAEIHSQAYPAFQEWHYERQLEAGRSEAKVQAYPTGLVHDAMLEWVRLQDG